MESLRNRILVVLAAVGLIALSLKSLADLERSDREARAAARTRAEAALLAARAEIEGAYARRGAEGAAPALARLARSTGARLAAMVNERGLIVAASRPELTGLEARNAVLAEGPLAIERALRQQGFAARTESGLLQAALPLGLAHGPGDGAPVKPRDPTLVGPRLPAGAGVLLIEADLSESLAAVRRAVRRDAFVASIFGLVALALVGLLLQLGLVRQARRVVQAMDRFDAGDRGARVQLRGPSELAQIGATFDALADRIQIAEADLLEAHARLDVVLRSLPLGIMVVRRDDGHPLYVNPRWRELFGIPMDATRDILSLLSTVRCERPDGSPYPLEQLPIPTALRTGKPAVARDLRVRRNDRVAFLLATAVPVSLAGGEGFDAVVAMVEPRDATPGIGESPAARAETPEEARPGPHPPAPAVTDPESDRATGPLDAALPGDRDTVLVLEGERDQRDRACEALAREGFRPLGAATPEEATELCRTQRARLCAAVLDLALLGPNADESLDALASLAPGTPVIASSGFRTDLPSLKASGRVSAILPRPYGAALLLRAVRDLEVTPAGAASLRAGGAEQTG